MFLVLSGEAYFEESFIFEYTRSVIKVFPAWPLISDNFAAIFAALPIHAKSFEPRIPVLTTNRLLTSIPAA